MAKLKDLCVVAGTYTTANGEDKKRWKQIGELIETKDGGQMILLDPMINLAAIQREAGRDRVMVSMFDPKENSKPIHGDEAFKRATEAQKPIQVNDGFDDSIPF